MDLFIQQTNGKKIVDSKLLLTLCSRLKAEMLHPFRVIIVNRGPDTELLVANPVELCGRGRPRVFYDVTLALKTLGVCIFSVSIYHPPTQFYFLLFSFYHLQPMLISSFSSLPICRLKLEDTQRRINNGKSTDFSQMKMVKVHQQVVEPEKRQWTE